MALAPQVEILGIVIHGLSKRFVFDVDAVEELTLLLANDEVVLLDLWYGVEDLVAEPAKHDGQLSEKEGPFEEEAEVLLDERLAHKRSGVYPCLPVVHSVGCSVAEGGIGWRGRSTWWRLHRRRRDSWTQTVGCGLVVWLGSIGLRVVSLVIGVVISEVSKINDVDDVVFLPRLSFLGHRGYRLSVVRRKCIHLNYLYWLVWPLRNDHRWQLWRHLGNLGPLVRVLIQYVRHLRQ